MRIIVLLLSITNVLSFNVGAPLRYSIATKAASPRRHLDMRWGLKGNTPAPSTTPDGVPIRDTGDIYLLLSLTISSFSLYYTP